MIRPGALAAAPVSLLLSIAAIAPAGGGTYSGDPEEPGAPGQRGAYVMFTKDHPVSAALADKALVYVVRPAGFGAAVKSFFFCDDEVLGINQGSSYFFAPIAPGKRVFWSNSETVVPLELNVEAGQIYYIQQHVDLDTLHPRTRLALLDDATGKEALAQCRKHGTITDSGRARGKEIARARRAAETNTLP
jgi:hypothetical protein